VEKDYVIKAFELSEKFFLPFIVDAPSALFHGSGELELGELPESFPTTGSLRPNFEKTLHDNQLGRPGRHKILLQRESGVREYAGESDLTNPVPLSWR